MFQSFNGNSRRPRQVNLSGRNANPFTAITAGNSSTGVGAKATLAHAHQDRLLRQQERDRTNAARIIQRVWRGHLSRRCLTENRRQIWDEHRYTRRQALQSMVSQYDSSVPLPFRHADEAIDELQLLLSFVDYNQPKDLQRLDSFIEELLMTTDNTNFGRQQDIPGSPMVRLLLLALQIFDPNRIPPKLQRNLMSLLVYLTAKIPKETARNSEKYYSAIARVTLPFKPEANGTFECSLLLSCVLGPLNTITSETLTAYEGFAMFFLTLPGLQDSFRSLESLVSHINYKLLANALATLSRNSSKVFLGLNVEGRLWLLAYLIYFHNFIHGKEFTTTQAKDPDYVYVVSILLSSLATEIKARINIDQTANGEVPQDNKEQKKRDVSAESLCPSPLPHFIQQEIMSLVSQRSVANLLSQGSELSLNGDNTSSSDFCNKDDARALASYALTLLTVFTRRADEIRMWIYLGSTIVPSSDNSPALRLPALKYFWISTKATTVFNSIKQNSQNALKHLIPNRHPHFDGKASASQSVSQPNETDQEWKIILLFLELLTFVLKVMDDEEFFSANEHNSSGLSNKARSWTRESALPLKEIQGLTVFLKNLAFVMYWNATTLAGEDSSVLSGGIGSWFVPAGSNNPPKSHKSAKPKEPTLAGIKSMTIDYVKGTVTGLLRMIYERDSRRKFLPDGHWLMTEHIDMDGFISAVVEEEENRHQAQEDDSENGDSDRDGTGEAEEEEEEEDVDILIGASRTQQTRFYEKLRRQQQKNSRKKKLAAVTPRLQILQNMPFFIPFETRVQIFRAFIHLDQYRRRHGNIDPDQWRMAVMHATAGENLSGSETLSKHHARIRRDNLFEDAFEQFYGLGDRLKEPIQISFVDKFNTLEAGIDGGGVMKEFLTSVTSEAFNPSNGLDLFLENDQNLLYPNPYIVERQKDILRSAGIEERTAEWYEEMRELMKRFEFLGRVIGKCMYEGILVDVNFARFFLLKWALTGGSSSASKESGYRANLNDLKDLDEAFYQGLLTLKNYPGDVAEDFSINFTVTDEISAAGPGEDSHQPSRLITRELKPGGSNIPVTNENRLVYISYVTRYRLQLQPQQQTNAFLRGLGDIIQPSWLSMFNQSELQTLVGGDSSEIDVADLRNNTQYGGLYVIGDDLQEHPTIKIFWEVMYSLSDTERRQVLKFVTSTPRAPLLGFVQLKPRFSIRDGGVDQERLPSTSTCVNLLKLPRYTDAKVLKNKLLYAIKAGAGFDLS
ncbi:MAG: hypothetical protein M1829_003033 [Trizodia sp. TS-e1964]|nr:MAG: hypothetical protein M1829_003033 [Trizodia sp. TS-e1964]